MMHYVLTENAALLHGVAPADWTLNNVAQMRTQFDKLGFDFQWDRVKLGY